MMKKTILLLLAAFCGVLTVAAQDLIIKADASKVEAKVTEITPESVRYKRFSNPDGPTYVLPVSEISYIQYANGEKEYFRAAASIPATPLTPALPAEEPANGFRRSRCGRGACRQPGRWGEVCGQGVRDRRIL